jgi:hypothetical protein
VKLLRVVNGTNWSRRSGRLLSLLLAIGLLAGCGSANATHSSTTASARATGSATVRATGAATAPTSSSTVPVPASSATASTPAASTCAVPVADTLREVAGRIYHEAATGTDVAQAVHRVVSSSALASAIDSGNAAAARLALRALMLGQIVRVQVLRGKHVFAQSGSGAAIAPARGAIPGTKATYVLSTQAAHSYEEVVHQVTGARVLLRSGAPPTATTGYEATTLTGSSYPRGTLHITLLVPTATLRCPGPAAQTRVETLGHVGELIYREELHSPDVAKTIRHIEASSAFQHAVATRNAAATRAAIVGFFREHIHVVRVRVNTSAGLLVDVGGPYVLAPVKGTVRSGGRVVGRFEMAIQDDAGYLKLAHLFTGAEVLMRTGERQVMGTLSPGPASVPDRGTVSYGGRTYEAYSFTGTAFPSGPLRISLLLGS